MGLSDDVRQAFRESLDGGDLGDARRAVGSEKAAVSYDDLAKELGVDRSVIEQMMRDMTDGPSRRPMAAELAEMDNDYLRQINNERGSVDPMLAAKIGLPVAGAVAGSAMAGEDGNPLLGGALGALGGLAAANPGATMKRLQEARMIGMLSGAALPKSVLGNVGAHLTAAAEMGSAAPIREMLRVPTNVKTAVQAFRNQPKTISAATGAAPVEGLGRLNLPGRLMGALDEASNASLQRSGLSPEQAQRLLLTTENPVGAGSTLNTALNTRLGRWLVPFQRIPVNQFSQGVQSLEGLLPKGSVKLDPVHTSKAGRALTVGSMGAGALAGDETNNPLALAMLSALAGPRALPFALGAGLTAGPKVLERVGVGLPDASLRDLYDPTRAIDQPALLRLIEQLTAQEQQ